VKFGDFLGFFFDPFFNFYSWVRKFMLFVILIHLGLMVFLRNLSMVQPFLAREILGLMFL